MPCLRFGGGGLLRRGVARLRVEAGAVHVFVLGEGLVRITERVGGVRAREGRAGVGLRRDRVLLLLEGEHLRRDLRLVLGLVVLQLGVLPLSPDEHAGGLGAIDQGLELPPSRDQVGAQPRTNRGDVSRELTVRANFEHPLIVGGVRAAEHHSLGHLSPDAVALCLVGHRDGVLREAASRHLHLAAAHSAGGAVVERLQVEDLVLLDDAIAIDIGAFLLHTVLSKHVIGSVGVANGSLVGRYRRCHRAFFASLRRVGQGPDETSSRRRCRRSIGTVRMSIFSSSK